MGLLNHSFGNAGNGLVLLFFYYTYLGNRMKRRRTKLGRGFPITFVDWASLMCAYNRKYGTNFKDEREMLSLLSSVLSPRKMAKRFGVVRETVCRRLDYYCIERNHKPGGPNNIKRLENVQKYQTRH